MAIPTPIRIQLLRFLRSHGLRRAERLREDEMRQALQELPGMIKRWQERINQSVQKTPTAQEDAPSSFVHWKNSIKGGPGPVMAPTSMDSVPEPEAALLLPQGERTFLRLIAVDEQTLFCTWDLDLQSRKRSAHGVRIRISQADQPKVILEQEVDPETHRWYFYLDAPKGAPTLQAVLVDSHDDVIATSNRAIVPRAHPAPPGPLLFATVPPNLSLRPYADYHFESWVGTEPSQEDQAILIEHTGQQAAPNEDPSLFHSLPTSSFRGTDQ